MTDSSRHRPASAKSVANEICEVGRRLLQRGFVAANEGNISVRIAADQVVCTPTLISKGQMKPADMCRMDLTGRQTGGKRKHTSEIKLHLDIYRHCAAAAVVHCHPPHVTAFAITSTSLPKAVLAEVELFLGDVPFLPYRTPGTAEFAALVRPHVQTACVAVLRNHGCVAWAESLERASWWTEVLDAYCRILILAGSIGPLKRMSAAQAAELRALRSSFLAASTSAPMAPTSPKVVRKARRG